jgi:hypothetical protein
VGVYSTSDGGTTWAVFGGGLPHVQVDEIEVVPSQNLIAAGTHGRGLFEIPTPVSASTSTTGYEYSPLTQVTLGTVTLGNGSAAPGNIHAGIDWGDGSPLDTSTGQVTQTASGYTLSGSHTYQDESAQQPGHVFRITAQVTDGTSSTTVTTTASIAEELLPDGTRGSANERFIAEVYRNLLGRPADMASLQGWSGLLDAGVSRYEVVRRIQDDPGNEYRIHLVDQLYQQFLQRSAVGDGGTAGWVALLAGGGSVEQVEAGILGSPEYARKRSDGTTGGWLNAVYMDLFHRPVDGGGRAGWEAFAAGRSLGDVALAIMNAPASGSQPFNEYRQHVVDGFYQQFLDRSGLPDPGSVGWAMQLQQGRSYDDVAAAIIADVLTEFFQKTAP